MRNDLLQILLAVLVLVFGAAAEELLPKVAGVGWPVLLAAVQVLAPRFELPGAVLFAIAAGAAEDAVSGLSPLTSVSFFLPAMAAARWSGGGCPAAVLTYPCYQLWLAVWVGGAFNVFSRTLLAFPVGLLTAFAVTGAVGWIIGKAAIDERG